MGQATARRERALKFKNAGNALFGKGDFAGAIEQYTLGVEQDSKSKELLANRALCYMRLEKHTEAVADAKVANQCDPEWQKGYFRLGQCLFKAEEYEEAATILYSGYQKNPRGPQAK